MLSFLPKTPIEVMNDIKERCKARRKALKYTQQELASRSGVSLGSLKRFEQSGEISLNSLLRIAFVLECLEDFERVCKKKEVEKFRSIEEIVGEGK